MRPLQLFFDIAKFTLVALLIITPFRYFVAQPFIVSGASMTPTIDPREYLVIDEISYRMQKPQRGDVVIFRYPLDPDVYFVKRVIGLPNEQITIRGGVVSIESEGVSFVLDEPYLSRGTPAADTISTKLTTDEYFVLGDNRGASSDSRVWGPLQEKFIIGRALVRLYPFTEATMFPGKHEFSEEVLR